ncbi:MAG: biotin/lipoate--protein ligase family protein [Halofilum sp. (in: g-proteobacteria)]|nr:biotin/lipoate--protein ligase family protein [Halofilum sp. (in: g-proteobacteria)]
MAAEPALPADLRLERLERASSAREATAERARAGAPEGTLVWVEHPERPRGRGGHEWLLGDEPRPARRAGAVPGRPWPRNAPSSGRWRRSPGRARSAPGVQPMTELHYRWPNDVLLDGGKAAGLWLDGEGAPQRIDWLVLSWAVNTATAPERMGFDAAALEREGAAAPVDAGELLQSVARQLVAAIATWDESGFEPVLSSWRGRLALGAAIHVAGADGTTFAGISESVDAEGALTIRADASTHRVTLARFFGLPEDRT